MFFVKKSWYRQIKRKPAYLNCVAVKNISFGRKKWRWEDQKKKEEWVFLDQVSTSSHLVINWAVWYWTDFFSRIFPDISVWSENQNFVSRRLISEMPIKFRYYSILKTITFTFLDILKLTRFQRVRPSRGRWLSG